MESKQAICNRQVLEWASGQSGWVTIDKLANGWQVGVNDEDTDPKVFTY